jgi:hypothetical protein
MELGFARFLEMFEERFGRFVTTLLMAALAAAAAAWALQTIIEATVYVYGLVKAANFIAALRTEHAAAHLIILAVQITITFVLLGLVWRLFWRRKIAALETNIGDWETRITGKVDDAVRRSNELEATMKEREERVNQRAKDLSEKIGNLKARQEKILAGRKQPEAKSPLEPPHPVPGPQEPPKTT